MIRIQGLHKFFNKGRQNEIHVINDISLDLPEKGMVAIFGKSGCGKTTLLNVIGGLDHFADGTLTIEQQDIRRNTDVIRNQYIGYIFQNYNLNKAESCFDNVADALRLCGMTDESEIEDRVMAALTNVGMEKYHRRTPDTLSGGQQQRIAIARAIVKNPHIILADEPTGNLDEANTVMIMDLLKAIARDHLVLLVTHEANLVDYYCDTVIELQDGRVVGKKQNTAANGFAARDKNDIYLGELTRKETVDENTQIEYYGEAPQAPIRLKIVNSGGKIYVQVGTEKVQILDEFSEIKLREGVYEEQVTQNAISKDIDMSKLPPIRGTRYGRLFSLRSSVKSGYVSNFKNRKKGKKVLRGCMCLFAAVIVLMSSIFGSAFGDIIEAKKAYNHNIFYLYTSDAQTSAKLNAAVGDAATGIDFIRLMGGYPYGDGQISFHTGSFETFMQYDFESNFKTNAVYLDVSLAKDQPLVVGKKEGLVDNEILITTKVADALLKKSTLGYISEQKDLLGLVSTMYNIDGKNARIVGIVESDEPAIYLSEIALAKYVRNTGANLSYTSLASDFGMQVAAGETILAIKNQQGDIKYPAVGETVQIQGKTLKVVSIMQAYTDYTMWMAANGIEKLNEYDFFKKTLLEEDPSLSDYVLENAINDALANRFYEYYDYLYSDIDAFYRDLYFFEPDNVDVWLYVEKGIEIAKYTYLSESYYKAVEYRKLYGSYPTQDQLQQSYDYLPNLYDTLQEYRNMHLDEFYSSNKGQGFYFSTYMVNEADYITFSKQMGETHPSAQNTENYYYYGDMEMYGEVAVDAKQSFVGNDIMIDMSYSPQCYTVIHSTDPEKTEQWLNENFSDLSDPNVYFSPDRMFNMIMESKLEEIITSLITMAVLIVLMSLCMYFIMRSSLMNRIKEVGIYRAIGVSKKNLVFKFFMEAIVLTTLTVFIGYVLTSGFLFVCLGMSSLVAEIFYYPLWLAGAILAILYVISLFFGTLPILSLLRKTPSEILAKYDI